MLILAHFLVFFLAVFFLAKSATYLVKTLTHIAVLLKVSEFTIAFILMAFATSLPELSVGISAALGGEPILSLGTVLGSNIANLTLIIGLPALIAQGIRVESRVRNYDIFYAGVLSVIPLVLLLDGVLSRSDGIVLVFLFVIYLFRLLNQREMYSKTFGFKRDHESILRGFGLFGVEFIALIGSAALLVRSASFIADDLKIPLVLVGLVLVSLGTSLPELTFELFSVKKRQGGLALGNILGSVVANSCLILGLTSLITPIQLNSSPLFPVSAFFWVIVILLFTALLRSQYKLSWNEGMVLVFVYALFILVVFSLESSLNSGF